MVDVLVIGGGHAGAEAALASARKGKQTMLVTGNLNMIASMPCNPSIGGPAKGIVVREIDALGGEMAKNTDKTQIQMRLLNHSKGPAVRALRSQNDKNAYARCMRGALEAQANLELREAYVDKLLIEKGAVCGIVTESGLTVAAKKVVMTTGTYLNSHVLVGDQKTQMGPDNQKPSLGLSPQLKTLGFRLMRLKTGTPPRVKRETIDFSKTQKHPGDSVNRFFSHANHTPYDVKKQYDCYLTYTNAKTHEIIDANLHRSAMYSGNIEGVGPRYCPSIEDKVVRFHDKPRHQIFLEPESAESDDIYVQGFSTSMPHDVQEAMITSLPGLEQAQISKYGYAIEYDAIDARQLWPTLESKMVKNLYMAGQINGTSGYEEAAGQGLVAGVNAALALEGEEPLVLRRHEAYIGVLIDDLVTKGTREPYRLLTSRAEHRLLLRNDNADERLMDIGYQVGLLPGAMYEAHRQKQREITRLTETMKGIDLYPNEATNQRIVSLGTKPIRNKTTFYDLMKRPDVRAKHVQVFMDAVFDEAILERVEITAKYEGYIQKANQQAKKMAAMDAMSIPRDIDYDTIHNLAHEAREKLKHVSPITIGQASRISGVNPSDISILLMYIKQNKTKPSV